MFEDLKGLTLKSITGLEDGDDEVLFTTTEGRIFKMYHYQDCCESVYIESVVGDVADLIGSEILLAEEVSDADAPEGHEERKYSSERWTFYKLATLKGYVDIRWFGASNGYYSTSVDFIEVE